MPIVQAWEHCRRPDCLYPIDCKQDYVNDLKDEAFYNHKLKFMRFNLPFLSEHYSTRHYSIDHIIDIINRNKKDFFKSCCTKMSRTEYEKAWALFKACRYSDLEIEFENVLMVRDFVRSSGYADIVVSVINWGFLSGLREVYTKPDCSASDFFFSREYKDDLPTETFGSEIEFDLEHNQMLIVTSTEEICSWVCDVIDRVNVYREIADYQVSHMYDFFNDKDFEYGQVPVY